MRLFALLLTLFALCVPLAHAEREHPEVASYPGSRIKGHNFKEFEEAQLLLSKPYKLGGVWKADKLLPVEGKVTYLHYEVEKTVSALQVFRNYQSSLQRSGFQPLFVCERPCIDGSLDNLAELIKTRDLTYYASKDIQYLAAQRGNTYVSLAVGYWGDNPQVYLFVVEKGQMDTGLMAVTGSSPIAQALASQGRVDVYGFLFDSGKAQLKPGSAATLGELAQVLRDNAALRLQLIGHTDDIGQAEANQALSLARAQAVMAALIAEQGIAPDRLQAAGKGASQPLGPNSDEAARARNRRVEVLVLQAQALAQGAAQTGSPRAAAPEGGSKPAEAAAQAADKGGKAADNANKLMDAADKLKRLFGR